MKSKKILLGCVFLITFLSFSVLADSVFKFRPTMDIYAAEDQFIIFKCKDAETGNPITTKTIFIGGGGHELETIQTNIEKLDITAYFIENRTKFLDPSNIKDTKELGTFITNQSIKINFLTNTFNSINQEEPEPEVIEEPVIIEEPEPEVIEEPIEEENIDTTITGKSITQKVFNATNIKWSLITIGALVAIFFVLLIVKKNGKTTTMDPGKEPRTIALSELKDNTRLSEAEKKLEEAEKQLRKAKEEIYQIKNKNTELSEAEEQFKKAQERLKQLKDKTDY